MSKKYSKAAVTVVAAVMLIGLYIIIFGFSSQDGEQSGDLSYKVSKACVEVANDLSGKQWSASFRRELVTRMEHPIRKLAHFTEYAIMGVLVYVIWHPWLSKRKHLYRLVVLWIFLSAVGDEFHQTFVPGRFGSFADVFLDTCGGVLGLLVCILLERLTGRKKILQK